MKRISVLLIFFMLLFAGRSLSFQDGKILYVGGSGEGNYTTIQEALEYASNGDKIIVYPGSYGGVKISKSVIMEGKNAVVKDIEITANNVSVDGFIIKDSYHGIIIKGNYCKISNCSLFNNSYGIRVKGKNNKILSNKIFKNSYYGIWIEFSSGNEIKGNEIYRDGEGIYIMKSSGNIISNNIVRDNEEGIQIQGSEDNIVKLNHVEKNKKGIHLCCKSKNNLIFKNNFINNQMNAYCFSGANIWDFEGIGNYWDDYNGNGAYEMSEGNKDNYPSPSPYNISEFSYKIYILSPKENEKISGKIIISGLAEREGKIEVKIDNGDWNKANGTFLWYFELNTHELENGEHTIYAKCENEIATCRIYVENEKTPSFSISMFLLVILLVISFRNILRG